MKTAFSTTEKRSFLTQSIDYSFSIDWSCAISANESFTVIETLTSAGIRAGPLCLMDLEINTTSFYFCFFSNTPSTELISEQYFKALSSSWTLASTEQKKLNRGPTWTEVCYVLLVLENNVCLGQQFRIPYFCTSLAKSWWPGIWPYIQKTLTGLIHRVPLGPMGPWAICWQQE